MNFKITNVQRTNLSDEVYFSSEYRSFVSNSRLKLLNPAEGGSYEVFKNPQPSEDKGSYLLGSVIHALLLEPDKYTISDFDSPTKAITDIFDEVYKLTSRSKNALSFDDALQIAIQTQNYYNGSPGDKRIAKLLEVGKPYYDYISTEQVDSDTLILPKALKETIFLCVDSINKTDQAKSLLSPDLGLGMDIYYEDSFTCDIEFEGKTYSFKGKIDSWSIDHLNKVVNLIDLKTTSYNVDNFMGQVVMKPAVDTDSMFASMENSFEPGSFQKFHYYRQMFIYKEILQAYLLSKGLIDDSWNFDSYMIVVQTTYGSKTKVFEVTDNWLDVGRQEFEYLIKLLNTYEAKTTDLEEVSTLTDLLNGLHDA